MSSPPDPSSASRATPATEASGSEGPVFGDVPSEAKPSDGLSAGPEGRPVSLARRALRVVGQLLLAFGVFFAVSHWQTRRLLPPGETPAPDFTLTTLQGEPVRLSDFRGKTVLLHFWATWCGVCRQEVGALNSLADSLDDDQVLVTIVADGDDRAAVERFVAERGVRYPVLLGNDELVAAYRVSMFPTNYFVDPSGRIAGSTVGMSTRWMLRTRMGCAR